MPQEFLLTCECGQKIGVTAAKAGGSVVCSCGKSVPVPKLGELKRLAPAKTTKAASGATWSPIQGGLFTLGGATAAIAFVVAIFYASRYVEVPVPEDLKKYEEVAFEKVDALGPVDTLDHYMWLRMTGIQLNQPPAFIQSQQIRAELAGVVRTASAIGLVGLIVMLTSLVGTSGGARRVETKPAKT